MPDPANPLFTGRMRTLQYMSGLAVLGSCLVFALLIGGGWSWPPFLLAPGIAILGLAAAGLITHFAIASLEPSEEQLRVVAADRRARNKVLLPVNLCMGLGVGVIAGSIPSYWPDVMFGVMMLAAGVAVPAALLPGALRKARAKQASNGW